MPKLLMNLRNVPDDEADEVRALLAEHGVDHYETKPSIWGISHGGIWLQDDSTHPRAKQLLDAYQRERQQRARAELAQAEREGTAPTLATEIARQPARTLLALLAALLLIVLTIALPYWYLRG